MREAALSARPPELTRRTLLTAAGHAATGGTMTDGQAGHETRPPDQRAGSTSIPVASPAQSATAPVAPTHHGVVLRGRRRERQHPRRLHLPRPVRRPRHHLRPHLQPAAAERSGRPARLPYAAVRSGLALRPRTG